MEYIGIDVHQNESQISILTEQGERLERRIRTQRERFAEILGGRARSRGPSRRHVRNLFTTLASNVALGWPAGRQP